TRNHSQTDLHLFEQRQQQHHQSPIQKQHPNPSFPPRTITTSTSTLPSPGNPSQFSSLTTQYNDSFPQQSSSRYHYTSHEPYDYPSTIHSDQQKDFGGYYYDKANLTPPQKRSPPGIRHNMEPTYRQRSIPDDKKD